MEYNTLNLLDLQPENIETVNIVHDKDVTNINVTLKSRLSLLLLWQY